ncbi:hypothetical protein C8N27_0595 [Tenacibaculum discolor]|nr:hypothetical protein C8N27_0595 [Tenacibaculum discolor]
MKIYLVNREIIKGNIFNLVIETYSDGSIKEYLS